MRPPRWTIWPVRTMCLGAVLTWTLGAAAPAAESRPAQIVQAEEIRLVDVAGKPRAALILSENRPTLFLYDTAGKPQVSLSAGPDGARLVLSDTAGRPRVRLALVEMRRSADSGHQEGSAEKAGNFRQGSLLEPVPPRAAADQERARSCGQDCVLARL